MFLDYFWNRLLLLSILTWEAVKFVWCAALLSRAHLSDSGESDCVCQDRDMQYCMFILQTCKGRREPPCV